MANQVEALVDRHAKNLLRLARSRQEVGQLNQQVSLLLQIFEEHQLQAYFSDLSLSHEDKLQLARTLGESSLDILNSLFEQILSASQEAYLYPILTRVYELLGYEQEEVEVYVTAAVSLTDQEKERFMSLAKRRLGVIRGRLVEKVEPAIIGGFILEANHQVIDTSIRHQLQELREETRR
ncbi:F0F1 ATP synthase subunit delta [Streptococcus entericus]|uniref:F0F1 ATP synthase subunit delta n=1 Tax=Streptococcus entericus TaxID=155680 RepID=UPI000378BABA|nr:F0F1 ATP synthase subunit delta [Streptococcus entericus]